MLTTDSAAAAPLYQSFKLLTPSLVRAACGRLPPNRRGEIRRSATLGCRVRRLETTRLVGDRTLDLSPQGMLVVSDEGIAEGSQLMVSFMATELPIWFDTEATVTRIVHGRRPGDASRALGLRFDTLPVVKRLLLRGHLRKLPALQSQREPPVELKSKDPDYAQIVRDILDGK
ncbi:MAG: PilZ domain-containing protein [Polyangiaceae bacterium]